jgi:hypothetical protein
VLEQRQRNNGGKTVYGRVQEKSETCRPLLCCIDCDGSLWNPSERIARPCVMPGIAPMLHLVTSARNVLVGRQVSVPICGM